MIERPGRGVGESKTVALHHDIGLMDILSRYTTFTSSPLASLSGGGSGPYSKVGFVARVRRSNARLSIDKHCPSCE